MIIQKDNLEQVDWAKGLIPAVIQDKKNREVLMVGYMNQEALKKTLEIGKVTFYSRSKERLWTKGESSGNFLNLEEIRTDCDRDALIITADPVGPTCHTGETSCFDEFSLGSLEKIINKRAVSSDAKSYTKSLLDGDEDRLIQKVGEEAVEVVIASKQGEAQLLNEMADLFYHSLVLLKKKGLSLSDVETTLASRN